MGTVTIIQGPTGVDISISGTTFPITDSTRTEGFSSRFVLGIKYAQSLNVSNFTDVLRFL